MNCRTTLDHAVDTRGEGQDAWVNAGKTGVNVYLLRWIMSRRGSASRHWPSHLLPTRIPADVSPTFFANNAAHTYAVWSDKGGLPPILSPLLAESGHRAQAYLREGREMWYTDQNRN